jgi:hypothetical protein
VPRDTAKWINQELMSQGYHKALEGMNMVRQVELHPGQVLYRFIDTSTGSPESAANGPWWLEYEYFQKIKHFALQHGYSLSYAVRLFAAILYEYSEVNAYVRAEVIQPLLCWKGRGKQVRSAGKDPRDLPTMTPMQSIHEVYQLYVPGIIRGGSLFGTAFKFIEYTPLPVSKGWPEVR